MRNIYCSSILKMAALRLPLNSYVYISYQAKYPFNFCNIKEDNHRYQSVNFPDIQDLPNLTRYCTRYFLCNHTALLPSPSIWQRNMYLEGRDTSLCTSTSTSTSMISSTSTGTSTSAQLPFLEQGIAGGRCIIWAGCTVLETEWCHMRSLQPWHSF